MSINSRQQEAETPPLKIRRTGQIPRNLPSSVPEDFINQMQELLASRDIEKAGFLLVNAIKVLGSRVLDPDRHTWLCLAAICKSNPEAFRIVSVRNVRHCKLCSLINS